MTRILLPTLKICLEIGFFAALTLLCTRVAFAQVIINEVMAAPSEGNEWVELKNISQEAVVLTNWSIEDNRGALTPVQSFQGQIIEAEGFFVFELKNKLNNNGDSVVIKNPDQEPVDIFQFASTSPTESWSRVHDDEFDFVLGTPSRGVANGSLAPTPSPSPLPSPSPASPVPSPLPSASPIVLPSPTPVPSPTVYSYPIYLSEIMACPETGQPEWIEWYNPHAVDLKIEGWKVKDQTGNTRTLQFEISAHSYEVIEFDSAIFNNDGDQAIILNQQGTQLIQVQLPPCSRGQSTIYTTLGWQQTTSITKLAQNTFTSTTQLTTPQPATVQSSVTPSSDSSSSVVATSSGSVNNEMFSFPLLGQAAALPELEKILSSGNEQATFKLPDLGQLVVDHSNPPVSSSISPSANASSGELSSPLHKLPLALFLLLSISLVAIGSYGSYQWYTERRAENALEIL
jgi:hypothetical protein